MKQIISLKQFEIYDTMVKNENLDLDRGILSFLKREREHTVNICDLFKARNAKKRP